MTRLCTYRDATTTVHVGMVVPAGDRVSSLDDLVPPEVAAVAGVAALIGLGLRSGGTDGESVALADVTLLAPIPRPHRNIFCIGKNYLDHVAELAAGGAVQANRGGAPEHPIVFTKPPSCVIGPGAEVERHAEVTSQLDYEAELAVVIGLEGRSIPAGRARDHIWGYTLVNDVTARDLQRRHQQWFLGKALDTFCPMGPWVVTADEIDATDLALEGRVNGELRQSASTADMIFDVPTLIETLSAGITLQPGDVIATGTPAGVGAGFDPPRWLSSGDVIEVSAPGLGTLTNRIA